MVFKEKRYHRYE